MGKPSNAKSNNSNKVRVVCRIRPLAGYEIKNGSKSVVTKVPGDDDDYLENDSSSSQALQIEDANAITARIWLLMAEMQAEIKLVYVRSKSNPADSVSRKNWALAKKIRAKVIDMQGTCDRMLRRPWNHRCWSM